jgi:hypothetical protein
VDELNFIIDMVEEQLVKGNLRWLANFNEVRRDYTVGNTRFPIYASGSLQERGFFLSRIYSTLVTPKYLIHFLLHTAQEVDSKLLRNIILSCKDKYGPDDWVFLVLVQSQPLGKSLKEAITSVDEKTIGITAYSLASKENVFSGNVLGKGLSKYLKLTEAKFEAFDLPSYLKSFLIIFFLSTSLLVVIAISGLTQAFQYMPLALLFTAALSTVVGYSVYKSRYHTTLTLSAKGFKLTQGNRVKDGKWSDYTDVTIYIAPNRETFLRLQSKENKFDLPISRAGVSRKEVYNVIRELIRKR